ncbi:MAG: Twin-arginine translocation protein TatA [uncultured Rubrobacteraceae bacterium]|uniref:Sec-independent protein translocase protein TatA n=1 Tax=uncultured Rubrobacteraceae bacterium TaxID=349277 RepID=A0A6J4RZT6_9ACTN|nr:MAG: Twin-arginine translocation protein TatA [uncultured Rubrobacteraceae bacterium]
MNPALIPVLGSVGPTELIIILTIVLLLFGAKKIPELAKGLGTGVREFKRGTSGAAEKDEVRSTDKNEAIVGGGDDEPSPHDSREDGADLAAERAAKRTEQQQR